MTFGENLKSIRKDKGYSQEHLAEIIGVSRQAVSKWENNTSSPSTNHLIKISKVLNVSIEQMIGQNATDKEHKDQHEKKLLYLTFFGNVFIATASIGYYGYYLPDDDGFIWHWVFIFLLSLGCIFYRNWLDEQRDQRFRRFIPINILFKLFIIFSPAILPFSTSLSLLIVISVAAIYTTLIIKIALDPW